MKNSEQALELFTATGIIRRALAAAGKRGAIFIPTPHGTFFYRAAPEKAPQVVERLCERLNCSPMTLASWLKDWNRQPLDDYERTTE